MPIEVVFLCESIVMSGNLRCKVVDTVHSLRLGGYIRTRAPISWSEVVDTLLYSNYGTTD
jgi:hypothetical protein